MLRNDYNKVLKIGKWPAKSITHLQHKGKGRDYASCGHAHPGHEIIYVDYGKVILEREDGDIELSTGDLIVVPEGEEHYFYGCQKKPFDFLNIVYHGTLPKGISGKALHLSHEERKLLFQIKEESLKMEPFFSEMIIVKLCELIFQLRRKEKEICHREKVEAENTLIYRADIVNYALAFIRENYSRPLDAAAVSRHSNVSKSYLRALLKKETGKNMREHLIETRMEAAKRLLRESPENITQTSYKVGYQSVPHFCRLFKKTQKMTPAEYAKSLGSPEGS